MGSRLSRPRFRLIDAISPSNGTKPSCADSPDSCAMPTGPISCFGEVSPVNRPISVRKISPAFSQFCSTLIFDGLERPWLDAS